MREFPSRKSGGLTVGFQTERRIRGPGWSAFPIAPSTLLEPPRGSVMQPRHGPSRPRLGPAPTPAHWPPWTPAGSRQGEATRSNPTEPLQGSRFTGLGGIQHPREALAALGIPGLHDASPVGLSDGSPPSTLGPVLDFLRISVSSAVHLTLAKRSGREHGVTAPAHRGNHGAGAAAPYPLPFCLRPTGRPTETARPRPPSRGPASIKTQTLGKTLAPLRLGVSPTLHSTHPNAG